MRSFSIILPVMQIDTWLKQSFSNFWMESMTDKNEVLVSLTCSKILDKQFCRLDVDQKCQIKRPIAQGWPSNRALCFVEFISLRASERLFEVSWAEKVDSEVSAKLTRTKMNPFSVVGTSKCCRRYIVHGTLVATVGFTWLFNWFMKL